MPLPWVSGLILRKEQTFRALTGHILMLLTNSLISCSILSVTSGSLRLLFPFCWSGCALLGLSFVPRVCPVCSAVCCALRRVVSCAVMRCAMLCCAVLCCTVLYCTVKPLLVCALLDHISADPTPQECPSAKQSCPSASSASSVLHCTANQTRSLFRHLVTTPQRTGCRGTVEVASGSRHSAMNQLVTLLAESARKVEPCS